MEDGRRLVGLIVTEKIGWTGLGFALGTSGNPLVTGDWIIEAGGTVQDRYHANSALSGPVRDLLIGGQDNVVGVSCIASSSSKQVYFERLLDTGDALADIILPPSFNVRMTAVASDSPVFEWDDEAPSRKRALLFTSQTFTVNLGTGFAQNYKMDMLIAHAVLMATAFGVIFIMGIIFARYVPRTLASWFILHAGMQLLGLAMVVAGFAVSISMVTQSFVPHFSLRTPSRGAHAILGLIAFIWVVLQALNGIFTKISWDREYRSSAAIPKPKVFPDKVHWYSGFLLPLIGFVNVFLGIYDWGVDPAWMGLWGGWFGLVVILLVVLEVRKRFKDKDKDSEISEYYEKSVALDKVPAREASVVESSPAVEPEVAAASLAAMSRTAPASDLPSGVLTETESEIESPGKPAEMAPQAIPAPVMPVGEPVSSSGDEEEEATRVSYSAFMAPETPLKVLADTEESLDSRRTEEESHDSHRMSIPIPVIAEVDEHSSERGADEDDEEHDEERSLEIAKETDGELASTEDTWVPTPGRSRNGSAGSMDANTARELDELEEISRAARVELDAMENSMRKFE